MQPDRDKAGPTQVLDVAIVGAGAGGAYAAYRMMKAKPGDSPVLDKLRAGKQRLNAAVFEENDRVGGRLWSHHVPQLPDIPIELGGQGFSELQQNVYGLCTKELKDDLTVVDCTAFSLGPQVQYQRRHRYPYKAYSPLPPDPATLAGLTPAERAARLRQYRAVVVRFCPSIPPLPEPLERQPMSVIAGWCNAAAAAIKSMRGYYPDVVPFFVDESEKFIDPFQLFLNVMFRHSPPLTTLFNEAAAEVQKNGASPAVFKTLAALADLLQNLHMADGQPLSAHGFWNAFAGQVSSEAYNMCGLASFASSSVGNWNLYDSALATLWGSLMYVLKTPFQSIQQGYDQLPATLLNRFQQAGGTVELGRHVHDIAIETVGGEDLVALTIAPTTSGAEPWKVYARYAILALPRKALDTLATTAAYLKSNAAFMNDLRSVEPVRASKAFLAYSEPWWTGVTEVSIPGGYSTTDLPIRACYYMGSQQDGASLVLASLSDELADTFWAGYQIHGHDDANEGEDDQYAPGYGFESIPTPPLLGGSLPAVTAAMKERLQLELRLIHGIDIPDPIAGPIYMNWSGSSFGGGWHNFRPGVKSWEVIPRIRKLSVADSPRQPRIFVCGEAYSSQQGWVEGALNTAEMVLETYFGVTRPDWVVDTYDFGP